MKLHEEKQLFADAINAASRPKNEGGLGIKSIFIEKDYWISRSLKLMAEGDTDGKAVFKGGTSLSKAYGIGARFSEDIDVAIAEAWTLNGNQLKNLIRRTAKNMTAGLEDIVIPGVTSKGSHYHKAFYAYPRAVAIEQVGAIKAGQLLVEINSFANPYPSQLSSKIRHFYDLYFLLHDTETYTYLQSEDFKVDLKDLFDHDQQEFEKPDGWQSKAMNDSPLLTDFHEVWNNLKSQYLRELPDLAYQEIPTAEEIEDGLISRAYE